MRHSVKTSKVANVSGLRRRTWRRRSRRVADEAMKEIASSVALVVASPLPHGLGSSRGSGSREGFASRFSRFSFPSSLNALSFLLPRCFFFPRRSQVVARLIPVGNWGREKNRKNRKTTMCERLILPREIVYPCIPDPNGEDEGGQASSSLAVSTRWISVAKRLSDLATLAQREGGE
ncbi:hypothetical protein GW17_00058476 [Ensete ventricosum]|nr:hypothetical protein GW17_00058476 [Ensete ventricosum]